MNYQEEGDVPRQPSLLPAEPGNDGADARILESLEGSPSAGAARPAFRGWALPCLGVGLAACGGAGWLAWSMLTAPTVPQLSIRAAHKEPAAVQRQQSAADGRDAVPAPQMAKHDSMPPDDASSARPEALTHPLGPLQEERLPTGDDADADRRQALSPPPVAPSSASFIGPAVALPTKAARDSSGRRASGSGMRRKQASVALPRKGTAKTKVEASKGRIAARSLAKSSTKKHADAVHGRVRETEQLGKHRIVASKRPGSSAAPDVIQRHADPDVALLSAVMAHTTHGLRSPAAPSTVRPPEAGRNRPSPRPITFAIPPSTH